MSRELPAYRDNLERIIDAFPGKELLTVTEVATYIGKTRKTTAKLFPFKKGIGISIATLARCLS